MALWGKTDNLAGKPKYVARKCLFAATGVNTTANTISLKNANTNFATGDAVYYSINGGTVIGGLVDTTIYYVRRVDADNISLYDTQGHAAAGGATGLLDITSAGVGTHTLQKTLNVANTNDHTYPSKVLVFVDQTEAQKVSNKAKGIHGGGWYLYSTYTDAQSQTRHKAELLAELQVLPAASGDAEDTIAADVTITIGTQPANVTGATDPDDVSFTVVATASDAIPAAVLAYQWQTSANNVTYTDITNDAVYGGATTATLTLTGADKATYDGLYYRCNVSVTNLSGVPVVTTTARTLAFA